MNRMTVRRLCLATLALLSASACHRPKGGTVTEKRDYVQNMQRQTLAELYQRHPQARREIATAAGYGVFSDIGTHLIITATGQGYGVVTNNRSGEQTYMRMGSFGAGLGIGLQHFKAVFVFEDEATVRKFVNEGWEFGGEVDSAAKTGSGAGGDIAAGASFNKGIRVYRFTEAGIMIEFTVAGTKYWADKELN